MALDKQDRVLKPFEEHGFYPTGDTGEQVSGNCIFCDEEDHFFVSKDTGKWDCKKCGKSGNLYKFLTQRMDNLRVNMTDEQYVDLARLRGIPSKAFKLAGICYDGVDYLIPARSPAGYVNDIRKWNPRVGLRATTGCKLQLWNGDKVTKLKAPATIWLCEGEWDGIAMQWMLNATNTKNAVAVAVPGASIFKEPWYPVFNGHHVMLCYDHDDAGYSGVEKAYTKLKGLAKSFQFVNWPDHSTDGFDLRDFTRGMLKLGKAPRQILDSLGEVMRPTPKRPIPGFGTGASGAKGKAGSPGAETGTDEAPEALDPSECPTFEELLRGFREYVHMEPDLELALKIILAACLTERLSGDPLWMYIVSPPGAGKTLLLSSTQDSEHVVYRSTVTPHSLVSGFRIEPDPSLLARVANKVLVFKDGTELLGMAQPIQDEVFNIFRGAYDGHVEKSYGNGVTRIYSPLHFTMLIGVTPVIDGHNKALLGERFMKFRIRYKERQAVIQAAMANVAREKAREDKVHEQVVRFLRRHIDGSTPPRMSPDIFHRVAALAELTAMLRATVERDKFSNEMFYRPEIEVASRLGKQLVKLGMGLALVENRDTITESDYEVLYRVACDTGIGFHMDIVHALAVRPNGVSSPELVEATDIPSTTLARRLESMLSLGIVVRKRETEYTVGKNGVKPYKYYLASRVRELWTHVFPARHKRPAPPIVVRKAINRSIRIVNEQSQKAGILAIKRRMGAA